MVISFANADQNRDELFALKEFRQMQNRPNAGFDKEKSMLNRLQSYESPHLTKRIVSWTQGDTYCILFPLAKCNLADYMRRFVFSGNEKDKVWLLEQFCGLADALRFIHALRPKNGHKQLGIYDFRKQLETGWHHDVKPANILCFNNADSEQEIFQLCDFGSSKINVFRSRSLPTSSPRGTPTYEPPETIQGDLSRPSDVWAFGCVLLDIVTWAVDGSQSVQAFHDNREGKRSPNSAQTDYAFWTRGDKGAILREPVREHIVVLERKVSDSHHRIFLDVLNLINEMLNVDKSKRIVVEEVHNRLSVILAKAKAKANNEQSTTTSVNGGAAFAMPSTSRMPVRSASSSSQRGSEMLPPVTPNNSSANYASLDVIMASPTSQATGSPFK